MKALLSELIDIPGVSGYEERIADRIAEAFFQYCPDVRIDPFYTVAGILRGREDLSAPKVLVAAHMDEIGLMVNEILEDGFLRFTQVGGVDPRVLPAQAVLVHGRAPLFGVIASKPPHLQSGDEMKQSVPMKEMCIDLGLSPDAVREQVRIGDLITFVSPLQEMQGSYVNGKSLDDRAGVVLLVETMAALSALHFEAEVHFTATVQEEVGTRGAVISTYRLLPDIGIAIDVTHGDSPDAAKEDTFGMDKGIVIAKGPNLHPGLTRRLMDTAQDLGIPFQVSGVPGPTGTDARSIQISRYGVPTLLVELPLRYMHTPVETLNLEGLRKGGRLLAHFIASLKEGWQEWLNY